MNNNAILGLFDKYFLLIMVVQGLIVAFYDHKSFKKAQLYNTAKKARIIGLAFVIVWLILYVIAETK